MMEAQFDAMEARLEELTVATAQPEIIADVPKWQAMLKEMAQLEPAVMAWRQYRQLLSKISQAKEMRNDPDLSDMAEEELKTLLPREEQEREQQPKYDHHNEHYSLQSESTAPQILVSRQCLHRYGAGRRLGFLKYVLQYICGRQCVQFWFCIHVMIHCRSPPS